MAKIIQHVKGKKQSKSLQLYNKFVTEKCDIIRPTVLFNAFVFVTEQLTTKCDGEDSKALESVYFLMLDLADQGEFTERQLAVLDTFYIKAVIEGQFSQIDSGFKLSQVTKTLQGIIEDELKPLEEEARQNPTVALDKLDSEIEIDAESLK